MRFVPTRTLHWLLLVTALVTFLIQSGELGTSDTTHRLQVTHSFWTSEPQVFPYEYPEFGVHGRGGHLYAWYGMGQSLLMLPADLVGTGLSKLPLWSHYVSTRADPTIRAIVVTISTNVLISVLTALVAFRLLGLLGFYSREAVAGTLALLCATTHLHYSQNMMENNYILLLTLTGAALQYKWFLTGNKRFLILGAAALGLNLLTRITTALDIWAVAAFLILASVFTRRKHPKAPTLLRRATTYVRYAVPIYAAFMLVDRIYQYIRFGSWTNTYVAVMSAEQRHLDPTLPANFPFNGHWFHGGIESGVFGPLISPDKSIFLFDPMFALMLLLAVVLWPRLQPSIRAFVAATMLLLAAYISLYAGYLWWAGDDSWGDRYISTAVELATLLAVPLLLRYRRELGRGVFALGVTVTAISVAIQFASIAFWLPLEIHQMDNLGPHKFVVAMRLKNVVAAALGKQQAWGLVTDSMKEDPWDYVHVTTWNFLPSLLRHIGVAPLWAVDILYGVWAATAIALVYAAARLLQSLAHPPSSD